MEVHLGQEYAIQSFALGISMINDTPPFFEGTRLEHQSSPPLIKPC